ncbi:MAG: hypothetical protein A3C43_10465 [Candidatus Schekmanbacteria bacterium RIFCSPHIGHO2_02_FULL_38_11]|uniref:prephenate dehydrogenase n=1 Tax=Candidatus Schekmanbacteria bacterium RIFCSPLOWO2_12_FULL_38_15 TaxID=1817883 RepID=A0A1F7SIV3_9BACT|nr:MAG: hypothetical protein A2043_07265 [Candidatus Schekmanbacteria bacterium GWA2_38_9]OGL49271.1 MAG: hypothetical protein A3H37_04840 [Candidatus Schekmanbacteria bacterium RIFCSPLOWO2_02_FULL_38_14]OGL53726.1 MAG: hypothetical protein A3G31_03195 [Candidatus Schekmanbacteria bacterium RIFCSPLOWO2_12_FULL_38_15]OGL54745.1 MAG: hypothetical protein A3C43_10465 [Candidatus Schekmanbacteria bacterium RIFCSPHIGHO2_02_FULL_38_11]
MKFLFNKIAIVGLGFIGGSLGLAIKKKKIAKEILGIDIDQKNLSVAKKLKIIDYAYNLKSKRIGFKNIKLVIIATPVKSIARIVKDILPVLDKGTVITDTGSVKMSIMYEIEKILPDDIFFIGGHPIAGSEHSGAKFSDENLFAGMKTVLTPTAKSDSASLRSVRNLWKRIGSKVVLMTPEEHDTIFASVSHLPHVLAFSMINTISSLNCKNKNIFSYTGGGFRDFTRIAKSNPLMWHDIVFENKNQILASMDYFIAYLENIKSLIKRGEWKKIRNEFSKAQNIRRKLN